MHLEVAFFDKLRSRIKNHFRDPTNFEIYFNDFMKLISLFCESVITLTEFMDILTEVSLSIK